MAAGDLDRESVYGDGFMYHDEAAIAWVPDGQAPATPHIRVVDYASTGVIAPAPVDLATALPAPGAMKKDPVEGGIDWFAGTLGLAPGDFDGDSLNELAYTWQDGTGAFRVTMLEYRAALDGTKVAQRGRTGRRAAVVRRQRSPHPRPQRGHGRDQGR